MNTTSIQVQPHGLSGPKTRERRTVMMELTNLGCETQEDEDRTIELYEKLGDLANANMRESTIDTALVALATGGIALAETRSAAEKFAVTLANFFTVPVTATWNVTRARWNLEIHTEIL